MEEQRGTSDNNNTPGIWFDGDVMHVDLDEFIRGTGGNPRDPAAQAAAEAAVRQAAAARAIPVDEVWDR